MKLAYLLLNLLQALFLAVWSAVWIAIAFVVAAVTLDRNMPLVMARRIWAPALIWASGARFEVDPLPDLDWSQPHIFVMNHQSMLDIACAFAAIPANLRFVAKKSLQYVPFLGWYMWMTRMIFVDRSNKKRSVRSLVEAAERVRAGASILVYPEGTRSRTGRILPFKNGPFALALEAKVPIVPVAIEGSFRVAPADGFSIRPGKVRLKMGTPVSTAHWPSDRRQALVREVREALIRLHRDIGGASEPTTFPGPADSEAGRSAIHGARLG